MKYKEYKIYIKKRTKNIKQAENEKNMHNKPITRNFNLKMYKIM